MLELKQFSDRIWYSMFEEERDRPCLGYIRGDRWSVAVDAGHSDAHVEEFYDALEQAGLPLPSLTVITHWHWDHSFGMHRIHGLSVANAATSQYLRDFAVRVAHEGEDVFLSLDESIRKEYAGNRPVVIVPADLVFENAMGLDPGGVQVRLLRSISPHTDDSTLVLIPEERFLFFGDAISGVFPSWERDPVKAAQLGNTIRQLEVSHCLGGHWPLMSKREILDDLYDDQST